MQSGFVYNCKPLCLRNQGLKRKSIWSRNQFKIQKRTLGSTKPNIISMKRARDKNCCTWREKRCFDSFQHHTCGTQIGGIKEIWRRHILWFCTPILNKLSQLYALDLIQLLSVFPPGCLASWHRVFFVRVIQLEGAISPSGVAWREEPNPQAQVIMGPWGGKFQVKILVPKNAILRWKNSKAKH